MAFLEGDNQQSTPAEHMTDESTTPFTEGYYAALDMMRGGPLDVEPLSDIKEPTEAPKKEKEAMETTAFVGEQKRHILQQLDFESQPFRILIYPEDDDSLRMNKGAWSMIPCKDQKPTNRHARCMTICQDPEDCCCEIWSPMQCALYYERRKR